MSKILARTLVLMILLPNLSFGAELVCVSLKGNDEFLIDISAKEIIRHGKRQKIFLNTTTSHYGFSGENWYCLKGGCLGESKFTASINRATGLATTDNAWGYKGGVDEHFTGTCRPVEAPKM